MSVLQVEDLGHSTVVRFPGHGVMLDCRYNERMRERLYRLAEGLGGRRLVVDFGGVEFLYSDVLATLVALHKRVQGVGGHLVLCNLAPKVYEVFQVTHLHNVLDIRKDEQAREPGEGDLHG